MEIIDKIIALFYSMIILGNALYLRKVMGTWIFPGCLFSLFWFFYTFVPLIVLFEIPVNSNAIAFITLAVILFSWTFIFFDWKSAFKSNLNKSEPSKIFDTSFLRMVLFSSIIISLVSAVMQLLSQGFGLKEVITNLIKVANEFADARYTDNMIYTIYGPISLLFSNIAVIIGGLIFGSTESSKNKKILFAFLPSVVILLTQSSKGLFFQSVFLFLGGILITKLYKNQLMVFSRAVLLKSAFVCIVLIGLISVSFLSRGLNAIEDFGLLFYRLRGMFATYFFGHIYGFSDWFTAYTGGRASLVYDTSNYYFGFYTLTTFFKMFGVNKVTSAGVFDEYFIYGDVLDTNIYTMFRGLIMDFGMIGGLIFMLLNGFILNLVFYVFLQHRRPLLIIVVLIMMLEYFYMSFIISLLTWNIIPFTLLVCYLILKFNSYRFVFKPAVQK